MLILGGKMIYCQYENISLCMKSHKTCKFYNEPKTECIKDLLAADSPLLHVHTIYMLWVYFQVSYNIKTKQMGKCSNFPPSRYLISLLPDLWSHSEARGTGAAACLIEEAISALRDALHYTATHGFIYFY